MNIKTLSLRRACTLAVLFHLAGIASAAASRPDPAGLNLRRNAQHVAIFCGADGTELSRPYAEALLRDLDGLEAAGLRTDQAIDALRAALCVGPAATVPRALSGSPGSEARD